MSNNSRFRYPERSTRFSETRVPIQTLFWHLEKGINIEYFPSISKVQAVGVLEIANKIVNSTQLDKIYEAVN